MLDLIVLIPDLCLSVYFAKVVVVQCNQMVGHVLLIDIHMCI